MACEFILHDDYHIIDRYNTAQGAKSSYTRKYKNRYPNALITHQEEFYASEPTVQVRSLGNGAIVDLKKSYLGTCCDPSTERYWTM